MNDELNPTDADRLKLLDRITDRVPELDLSERRIDCVVLRSDGTRVLTGVEPDPYARPDRGAETE